MKVIYYSSGEHREVSKVQKMISAKIPVEGMEVYNSIETLSKRLRFRRHVAGGYSL